ncbi:MAG: S41 family peptidase [Clostridia bacterium]|nr:S41 family peptidase [Clostridia bacterium]
MADGPDFGSAPRPRWRRFLAPVALVVATAVVTYAATDALNGYIYAQRMKRLGVAEKLVDTPNFGKLLDVLNLIQENYYQNPKDPEAHGRSGPPPLDKLMEGAVAGAVAALHDPYSMYFDASALKDFKTETSGRYAGIGVLVEQKEGYTIVLRPFPGTPAAETPYEGAPAGAPKGLQPGDRIVAVDGKNVVDQDVADVASAIKGQPGTQVRITVLRSTPDGDQRLDFVFRRATIEVPLVETKMLSGSIGYVELSEFDEVAVDEFRKGLQTLRDQGAKAIVLDLRNNPGGLLDVASAIAGQLLPPGPLAYVVDRTGKTQVWEIKGSGRGLGLPMAVLVNGYTASAAEILAGAIQDYGAGTIIGERTFGKAVVQRTYTYDDNTGVKLTVAQWLTPKKRSFNKTGLTPDITVKEPADAIQGDLARDPQLQQAVRTLAGKLGEPAPSFPAAGSSPKPSQ